MAAEEVGLLFEVKAETAKARAELKAVQSVAQSSAKSITDSYIGVAREAAASATVQAQRSNNLLKMFQAEEAAGIRRANFFTEAGIKESANLVAAAQLEKQRSAAKLKIFLTEEAAQNKHIQGLESGVVKAASAGKKLSGDTAELIERSQAAIRAAENVAKGAENAISRTTSKITTAKTETDGLAGSVEGLAGRAGVALAAVTAVVGVMVLAAKAGFDMAQSAAEAGSKIHDLSQRTGVSTLALSGLKVAAGQTETSFESLIPLFDRFNRIVGQAAEGNQGAINSLRQFGLTAGEVSKDSDAALAKIIKRIYELPTAQERASAAMKLFGRSGAQLIPVIEQMNGNLDASTKKAIALGQAFTEEAAKAADEFGDNLKDATAAAEGLEFRIGNGLIPEITKLFKVINAEAAQGDGGLFGLMLGAIQEKTRETTHSILALIAAIETIPAAIKGGSFNPNLGIEFSQNFQKVLAEAYAPSPENRPKGSPLDTAEQSNINTQDLENARAEAERIYKQDTAAAEVEYQKRSVSFATSINQQLIALEKKKAAELSLLQLELDAAKESAETEVENSQQAQDKIAGLLQRQRDLRTQFNLDEKKLLDSRVKYEQDLQADKLEGLAKKADEAGKHEIETLKAHLDRRAITLEAYQKRVEEIENGSVQREQTLANAELARAGADEALKQKALTRLDALESRKTQIVQEQTARRRALYDQETEEEEARANRRNRIANAVADGQIALIRDFAERGRTTFEAAAKAEAQATDDRYEQEELKLARALEREQSAKEVNLGKVQTIEAALRQLGIDRANAEDESFRRIDAGRQRDLQLRRSAAAEVANITASIAESVIRARQIQLELFNGSAVSRVNNQESIDLAGLELERNRATAALQRQIDALQARRVAGEQLSREEEKQIELLAEQITQQNELFDLESKRIQQRAAEARFNAEKNAAAGGAGGGFFDGLSSGALQAIDPIQGMTDGLTNLNVVVDAVGQSIGAMTAGIAQGIGAMVRSFVLVGNAGGSFRKLAAEVVASLAQMAITQAVFELAEGLAMSALFWFTGNPKFAAAASFHYLSAAAFGAIGGIAAVSGRALAGSQFQPQGAGGGASGTGANSNREREPIVQGRPRDAIRVQVNVVPDGTRFAEAVTAHVVEDFENNGATRQLMTNGVRG